MWILPVKVLFHQKNLPSERGAYFHGLRCHYQILLWSLIDDEGMKLEATDWGWKTKDGLITPIMTDKEVAPESLIKVIRCKCKVRYD